MKWEKENFLVSTDPDLLDLDFICRSLRSTYWAAERPDSIIKESIKNSLCLGLFKKKEAEQIGFARVVTDHVTFSWLCDVIIDMDHRGAGLGKWLVSCVVDHPSVRNTTSLLGTLDAHGLYEKFGYTRSDQMRRPRERKSAEPGGGVNECSAAAPHS